jgi:hypothetical protein
LYNVGGGNSDLTTSLIRVARYLAAQDLPSKVHAFIMCMDGNFGQTHRSHAGGHETDTSEIGKQHIADLTKYPQLKKNKTRNEKKDCSSFSASENSEATRNPINDINGIFGASCARHNFPLKEVFTNFYKGEQQCNADLAVLNVFMKYVEKYKLTGVKLFVLYDISCQYVKNLFTEGVC